MEPFKDYKNPISGALSEIAEGVSSLHMEPRPIPNPEGGHGFLSETDWWVAHSIEHFREARKQLHRFAACTESIRLALYQLEKGDVERAKKSLTRICADFGFEAYKEEE